MEDFFFFEGLVVGLKRKHPLETDEVDRPSAAIQNTLLHSQSLDTEACSMQHYWLECAINRVVRFNFPAKSIMRARG